MAGRDVGRINRFIGASAASSAEGRKRQAEHNISNVNLQIMMANAAYIELFEDTRTLLTDTQRRLDILLDRVQAQIELSEAELETKLNEAARLPDGARIFKDKKGDVRAQNGALVASNAAATVLWHGNEPSFEDIQASTDRIERLNRLADDVRLGQAEIGDMQAAMADEAEYQTGEELENFQKRANEIIKDAEKRLNAEMARDAPVVTRTAVENTSKLPVPKL